MTVRFGRRRHRRSVALALTTALVAGGVAVEVRRSGTPRLRGSGVPSGAAPSPSGSALPSPTPSALPPLGVGQADTAPVPSRAAVAAALNPAFADPRLGPRVSAVVADAGSGQLLYSRNSTLSVLPASTAKMMTAVAALHVLGPHRRLTTKVVAVGARTGSTLTGRLLLVGAGDPTLASPAAAGRARYPVPALLDDLAEAVRAAGITDVTGGVAVDPTLFAAPRLGPAWKPNYLTEGSVAPVTSVMVDAGRVTPGESERFAEPDLAAGRLLRDLLRRRGVRTPEAVVRAAAPPGAEALASVESPPVAALVERMLAASDNNLAESLAHLVAAERGRPTTFVGAAQAVADALGELGAPGDATGLVDGSGLSPLNRVTTAGLARVLALTLDPTRPGLRTMLSGLPVGGFAGTLSERYVEGPAAIGAGRVRAKTGSLNNVSTLAGFIETADGRLLVFAFSADRLPSRAASRGAEVLDVAAARLAACGCPA
ncbi:MAG TPA: D-alanyl-D-alanine carboxypeptidase/D-alanyl-D-alanine-endopeptidase [Mycobacteriales bacterium]|nr:D-alanyl-D-alanine carboxypeptidase/D-alanyl-D-alanine-endopeptidase [Mycobacteriales bacterium]